MCFYCYCLEFVVWGGFALVCLLFNSVVYLCFVCCWCYCAFCLCLKLVVVVFRGWLLLDFLWTCFVFDLTDRLLLFVWNSLLFGLGLWVVRLLLYCDYLLFVGVLFTCGLVVVMVVLQFFCGGLVCFLLFLWVWWFDLLFLCLLFGLCFCVYLLIAACVDYLCLVLFFVWSG